MMFAAYLGESVLGVGPDLAAAEAAARKLTGDRVSGFNFAQIDGRFCATIQGSRNPEDLPFSIVGGVIVEALDGLPGTVASPGRRKDRGGDPVRGNVPNKALRSGNMAWRGADTATVETAQGNQP